MLPMWWDQPRTQVVARICSPNKRDGELVMTKMEKAEVLNSFFPAQFSLVIAIPKSLESLNLKVGTGGMKSCPL